MKLEEKIISLNYSPKEARGLILSGKVLINNERITSCVHLVKADDEIRIIETKKWVSRGSYKLLAALEKFKIEVKNKVCLDVGSSTGGFSHVLVTYEAKKIYALDVGTNQLDYKLRINPKIITKEKTNLKSINEKMFDEKIDFICCDVSFISIKKLFDVIDENKICNLDNDLVILIKPQFEATKNLVQKGGFVESQYHHEIIEDVINYALKKNFIFVGIIESPIKGQISKNIEYLAHFKYGKK